MKKNILNRKLKAFTLVCLSLVFLMLVISFVSASKCYSYDCRGVKKTSKPSSVSYNENANSNSNYNQNVNNNYNYNYNYNYNTNYNNNQNNNLDNNYCNKKSSNCGCQPVKKVVVKYPVKKNCKNERYSFC